MNNIKKFVDGEWIDVKIEEYNAFNLFKNNSEINQNYIMNNIEYTIKRDGNNNGIYIISSNDIKIPIADWNNVKVFITNQQNVNWFNARDYQTWAYYDYIYSGDIIRKYKSRGSYGHNEYIDIPINGINTNIIFLISRNENGTIYYERDDYNRTHVRISDNEIERRGYLGYYRRLTMSPYLIYEEEYLPIPNNIQVKETFDEDKVCFICNRNEQNIRFKPCNHTLTCSVCYLQLQHKRECPNCKQLITEINSYNS